MLDVYLGPDSDEETLGRWFKWLIWSVRDSESEEREARAHVKHLVKKGSPQSNVLKGHKAASWHDCRRKEGSFSGVSSGFTQIPCADEASAFS
jgi:hypothetical protein